MGAAKAEQVRPAADYKHIELEPYGARIGALVKNIDLARPLTPEVFAELRQAWLDNIVLFFHDQDITPQQQHDFLANFGSPRVADGKTMIPTHPDVPSVMVQEYDEYSRIGADVDWHADNSFREIPQKCSILYSLDAPATGGDTCWINMEAAYEALADPVRRMCDELTAIHDLVYTMGPGLREQAGDKAFSSFAERTPPVEHPLVRVNPDTGRRSLYVNKLMTARIKDVSPTESKYILEMLLEHVVQEEFMVRFSWKTGSAAFWDNRSSIHRGINDFYPQHRLMHRVCIEEESRPVGSVAELSGG